MTFPHQQVISDRDFRFNNGLEIYAYFQNLWKSDFTNLGVCPYIIETKHYMNLIR